MVKRKSNARKKLLNYKKRKYVDVKTINVLEQSFCELRRSVKILECECESNYVSNIEDKLNANTKYFQSVYLGSDTNQLQTAPASLEFEKPEFTPCMVRRLLVKLDQYKSSSPDGIPATFYRKTAEAISVPLVLLFNKSLSENLYPDEWKMSHVTPIFKSGSKLTVSNYRPISILCSISKVFERLMFNALYAHARPLISTSQHGFIAGRSTLTNLIDCANYVTKSTAKGGQIDTVFSDFSKAFDQVSRNLLLQRLRHYGIEGSMLLWFTSYLVGRSQFVVIGSRHHRRLRTVAKWCRCTIKLVHDPQTEPQRREMCQSLNHIETK